MGVVIKGTKTFVHLNENIYLHYFLKQPFIVFKEIIIHILEMCLFTHEVEIPWIWNHFILLLGSFFIYKAFVDIMFFSNTKIKCALNYSKVNKMLSNLLQVLTYFISRITCVDYLKCTLIGSCIGCCWFWFWIFFMFYDRGWMKSCTFDYNVGFHAKNNHFSYSKGQIWFQYQNIIQKNNLKVRFWFNKPINEGHIWTKIFGKDSNLVAHGSFYCDYTLIYPTIY